MNFSTSERLHLMFTSTNLAYSSYNSALHRRQSASGLDTLVTFRGMSCDGVQKRICMFIPGQLFGNGGDLP